MKFDHIGFFVKDLNSSIKVFENFIDLKRKTKIFYEKSFNVKIQFIYDKKNICYELIAPYKKNNPVDTVLESKNNILNHVAYKSKKFDQDIKKLIKKKFTQLTKPKKVICFKNKKVIFFLSPLNFIIELIEE
jgi:hypothetical protein